MTTATRKPRKKKTMEPLFTPVHAASTSTPVFTELARALGDPDLSVHECFPPDFGLAGMFEEHAPAEMTYVRHYGQVPAWAANTSQFLLDRAALADFARRNKEASDGGSASFDNHTAA